ncbi:MAG: hypothetical protein LBG44_10510 [Gemmatimonadota bacterium]|nr:hypothetical protein [Gemmatimonadota bacterium]
MISRQEFEGDWESYLTRKCQIDKLFGAKGMSKSVASGLEKVREKVQQERKKSGTDMGEVIYAAASGGKPEVSVKDRAATLKMIHHTYRIAEKGGQAVWVYSPPKDDIGWVYDEIVGDDVTVKTRLARETEIFSRQEMRWMSSSLNIARKVCGDARVKLGGITGANQKTKDLVKHWFLDDKCGKEELTTALKTLSSGLRKISVACESSTLVFADYPDWRSVRSNYYGAAFRGGEGGGFPVVYLEGAFTRLTGNSGKMWLCAETIIHELSHHEISTQDHRYDDAGLKPDSVVFPFAKAIDNADSWGYFALDLAGYLSKADHDRVWK